MGAMEKSEIPWASIEDLRSEIERGALSARELTDVFLERIDKIDPEIGGFVSVWHERARASARRLDETQAAGEPLGPLHGIPIAIKDLCDVAGEPTRAGTSVLGSEPARENAHVVDRLLAAGAVLVGKTKMTEGAFVAHHKSVTRPINPWRMGRWSGISSSGSGVAVAAGMCTAALGTDTGGSIRYPSAACALTSLKPTHGRISLHGISPFAPSMDTVGPMARSVQDAATLYAVMAGRDQRDGWSSKSGVPAPIAGPVKPKSRRVHIGIDKRFAGVIVDRGRLRRLHGRALPSARSRRPARRDPSPRSLRGPRRLDDDRERRARALPRRDLPGAGRASTAPSCAWRSRPGCAQSGVQVAGPGRFAQEFKNRLEACFEGVDVILSPVFPGRLGLDVNLLDEQTFKDAARAVRLATPFSVSGSPVLTPARRARPRRDPFSFQLVGPQNGEARLLALGQAYQDGPSLAPLPARAVASREWA